MAEPTAYIEVDLFSEAVDDPEHPEALRFRELLEDVASEYHCRLLYFDIARGTVTFSFDSDALMADIVKILEDRRESRF